MTEYGEYCTLKIKLWEWYNYDKVATPREKNVTLLHNIVILLEKVLDLQSYSDNRIIWNVLFIFPHIKTSLYKSTVKPYQIMLRFSPLDIVTDHVLVLRGHHVQLRTSLTLRTRPLLLPFLVWLQLLHLNGHRGNSSLLPCSIPAICWNYLHSCVSHVDHSHGMHLDNTHFFT